MGGSGPVRNPPSRTTKKTRKGNTKQGKTSGKKDKLATSKQPPAKQKETAAKKQVSKKKEVAPELFTGDLYVPFMSGGFAGEPTVLPVSVFQSSHLIRLLIAIDHTGSSVHGSYGHLWSR